MKLNRIDDRVQFFDLTHTYLLDGERYLIGVTELMRKQGLSPNYTMVDQEVLEHAADLGTQAHKAIEAYCDGLPIPETMLIKSFKKLGLDIIATEYLVSDFETVASSIDLVSKVDENTVDLIDMKRTSSVHKDALAAQIGFYKVFFEAINPGIKVRKCFCLPIKKGNKDDILKDTCGKLVEIDPLSKEVVDAILLCEKMGTIWTPDANPSEREVANVVEGFLSVGLGESVALLANLQAQVKEVEDSIALAKESIYNEMLSKGIDKLEVDGVSITLKRPYETTRVDSKALHTDFPDVYERVAKTSSVKGSITIKIK